MNKYPTDKIRNLALVGHSGSGKTTLTESILVKTNMKKKSGKIEDKNTTSDFSEQEKKRQISIGTSIIPVEWKDSKINLIDTPGYMDFKGEVYSALRASEAALVLIDATSGIEVGTEKVLNYTKDIELPRIIFVNKMDKENANFAKVVSDLHIEYSKRVVPFTLTLGEGENFKGLIDVLNKKAYEYTDGEKKEIPIPENRVDEVELVYNEIAEVVAEANDDLMEKYFAGEKFSHKELMEGITTSLLNGTVVPLIAGSANTGAGIDMLLDIIVDYMPTPDDKRARYGFRHADEEFREVTEDAPMSAVIFKTIVDPFVGKISIFKVISGKITKDHDIFNVTQEKMEKIGSLCLIRGKEQISTDEIVAGDIGAITKLSVSQTGDTLATKQNPTLFKKIKFPQANLYRAIEPKSKGDEDKISMALRRIEEEDPSVQTIRDSVTKQLLIGGQGNTQIQVVMDRLKDEFGVETEEVPFIISYKETIKGNAEAHGRHKKQSGGAGQFGEVYIRFEPSEDGFVFEEEVFGGSVPKNYFPAVEKGLEESLERGYLAGFPMINVKATLYDGSYHPVDSNEMAFKQAASLAFRNSIGDAKPILLEPVMNLEIIVPEDYMGDVMGDMNKRRGKILGMEPQEDGTQIIIAEAPQEELLEYAIDLRSMTQARGTFKMTLKGYEEVPGDKAKIIVEKYKK